MNNRKIREIVKFSLQKKIRNKWFVLLNIIILVSTVAMCNIDNIKNFLKNNNINLFKDDMTIEVSDELGLAKDIIIEKFKDSENVKIVDKTEKDYSQDIPKNYIYIEVTESDEFVIDTKIVSKEGIEDSIYSKIEESLKEARSRQFAKVNDVELEKLEVLNKELNVERIMLGVDSDNSDTKQMIKTASTFIIYFISIFIFSNIANEVAQEKVSKSIEYVMTSISAKEYLFAKIVSVIGFILIQGVYILVYYMIGNLVNTVININGASGTASVDISSLFNHLDKDILMYIGAVSVYGILTLILMAIIQAALSSKTTNMSEAGNTISFLMTITITLYMVTLFVITPYTQMSPLLYVVSCIPLVSNYFVPAIMIIGQANAIQIVVSLVLLVLSIPVAFKICSKIFKNGVLDYKPNNKKIKKKNSIEKSVEEIEEEKIVKETSRKYSFVIGISIMLWFVLQAICGIVLNVAISVGFNGLLDNTQIGLIVLGLTSIISLVVPAKFMSMYIEDEHRVKDKKMPIISLGKIVISALAFVGILQIALAYIYPKIGLDYSIISAMNVTSDMGWATSLLFVFCISVIPAVFEELLFRKVLIDYSRKIGKVFAIFVSAILFGVIHLNLGQGIFAFILGIILGIIYTKTGSIKTTMTIHFFNNFLAAMTVLFADAGNILNIITFSIIGIGIAIFLITIVKNRKSIKLIEFDRINLNKYKYLFMDYTFLIMIIITGLMFTVTENILKIQL